ncbi:ribokinase [Paracoccus pacificus]|uniref:Ribokinase n=1 Tax=Paracoccus pacificus TaxID=1463598 RepID=A0ABW4R6H6_9RHOB
MTVYNLGSINIDHIYGLKHLPQPGETISCDSYREGLGGKGANQSIAAARAGSNVIHVGAISAADNWITARMSDYGVDTTAVQRLTGTTSGHAIILLDDDTAENSIVLHGGANLAIEPQGVSAVLAGIGPGDTLLLQNETNLQVEAAGLARAAGARVIYSAAPFDIRAVRAVLPHVDILAMNEHEAEDLAAALDGDTPEVVAMLVTRGVKGAEYRELWTDQVTEVPAFRVKATDSTGAGDCFAGYFAAATDQGLEIEPALRLAAAAAALKVTRPGAGDAIPTREEVETFMKEYG